MQEGKQQQQQRSEEKDNLWAWRESAEASDLMPDDLNTINMPAMMREGVHMSSLHVFEHKWRLICPNYMQCWYYVLKPSNICHM